MCAVQCMFVDDKGIVTEVCTYILQSAIDTLGAITISGN